MNRVEIVSHRAETAPHCDESAITPLWFADTADLALIEARFEASGRLAPSRGSLAARLSGPLQGVVVGTNCCVSWEVDAGALHLYDILIDADTAGHAIAGLVALIEAPARQNKCAVLCVTLPSDDPLAREFESFGFVRDWEERDVVAGEIRTLCDFILPSPGSCG